MNRTNRRRNYWIGSMRMACLGVLVSILSVTVASAEDALERGRRLFNEAKYSEAVEVLEDFCRSIEGERSESGRYAEANYLLARIYFDAGEDVKVETYLKKALQADREIGRNESIKAFKAKVETLRSFLPSTRPDVSRGDTLTIAGINYEMVRIPAGSFMMGSETGDKDEKPAHRVEVSAFFLGKTEVTQAIWKAVMGSNPSLFKNGDDYPVESVSWDDVREFIRRLNEKTGERYRLPTEAEWEYACRAGSSGENYGDLKEIAWYADNAQGGTNVVGQKRPNAWGLHDMLGNVWEWCQDWYGRYVAGDQSNPSGPQTGAYRVFRGGSWGDVARFVRVAFRSGYEPGVRSSSLGFRLARVQ